MASDSSSSAQPSAEGWTKIGKGGRAVSFPPEAASAFGRRSAPVAGSGAPSRSYGGGHSRSEFSAEAASAFGRGGSGHDGFSRPERSERSERTEFDSTAAAAFGGRQRREPRSGGTPEFDTTAASAFGSGSGGSRGPRGSEDASGFPSAFGKKKSLFAEAAEMGFAEGGGAYGNSALARKRAEAARPPPPKPQTYEEMFPTLGTPAAAPKAAAATTPAPAKRSYAELMRERVAAEEAEAAHEAAERRKEEERRRAEMLDRQQIRRIYANRIVYTHTAHSGDADEEEYVPEADVDYSTHDLDHDIYGASKTAFSTVSPPHAHYEVEEEEDGEMNADIY